MYDDADEIDAVTAEGYADKAFLAWCETRTSSTPEVLGGAVVFKGTRLSVLHIGMLSRREPAHCIRGDYPFLSDKDITYASRYVRETPEGVRLMRAIYSGGHAQPWFRGFESYAEWIQDLSPDGEQCQLLGYLCVSRTKITPDLIQRIAPTLLVALERPESILALGQCDTIEIGIYDNGRDVRAWPVTFPI